MPANVNKSLRLARLSAGARLGPHYELAETPREFFDLHSFSLGGHGANIEGLGELLERIRHAYM